MEDKHICKDKWIYQFRIDLSENRWSDIKSFIDRENFTKYLGKFELGRVTKKPHFQGVLWRDEPMDANEKNKIRQFWKKDEYLKHKNSISITTGKKPESLCKYVIKDKGNCYTNLSNEEMERVGTWQTVKDISNKIYEAMSKWVDENNYVYIENVYEEYYKHSVEINEREFIRQYFKEYYKETADLPTARHRWKIYKMMYKLKVVPLDRYIEYTKI